MTTVTSFITSNFTPTVLGTVEYNFFSVTFPDNSFSPADSTGTMNLTERIKTVTRAGDRVFARAGDRVFDKIFFSVFAHMNH